MLFRSPIAKRFPDDLRFVIEKANSEDGFYSVVQRRPKAGSLIYPAVQSPEPSLREDFAIVQRFVVPMGSRDVIVIVIAGGTSLGTLAGARWVTSFDWSEKRRTEYARLASVGSVDSFTRIEAVLGVSAKVHVPAQPWEPTLEDIGFFANKGHNLFRPPKRIHLLTESGAVRTADDVQCVLFDNDEFQPGSKFDYGSVVAVCVKHVLDGRSDISFQELLSNPALWPNREAPSPSNPATFFRDHLQRRSLNGIVEVTASDLHQIGRAHV